MALCGETNANWPVQKSYNHRTLRSRSHFALSGKFWDDFKDAFTIALTHIKSGLGRKLITLWGQASEIE